SSCSGLSSWSDCAVASCVCAIAACDSASRSNTATPRTAIMTISRSPFSHNASLRTRCARWSCLWIAHSVPVIALAAYECDPPSVSFSENCDLCWSLFACRSTPATQISSATVAQAQLKLKRNVHGPGFALHAGPQAAFLEHLKHRLVVRQHFGGEFVQPGFAVDGAEVAHQCRADAPPLILVDDGEGDLRLSGIGNDIAGTADDFRSSAAFVEHCDQVHVIDEGDVGREVAL